MNDVRDNNGQELMYFDIPMEKYVAAKWLIAAKNVIPSGSEGSLFLRDLRGKVCPSRWRLRRSCDYNHLGSI